MSYVKEYVDWFDDHYDELVEGYIEKNSDEFEEYAQSVYENEFVDAAELRAEMIREQAALEKHEESQ